MSDDDASELKSAVFQVLLSLDGVEAKQRFLNRVFPDEESSKEELWKLVQNAESAGQYFSEASDDRTEAARGLLLNSGESVTGEPTLVGLDEEETGGLLGAYRIVRRIGAGGGGAIYEAEQEAPIRRRVAVKVLRHGEESKGIIARFEMERQALALMDHPAIAKVLDAGTTEAGRPFFVMELVEGEKITDYCDHHRLPIKERVELFIQLCEAIQHAHQKGIIHRDIKPSNVLVVHDPDGRHVPKVIDFGIAKATGARRLTDLTVFTSHDQFYGTPVYASPEQLDVATMDVDTRTDVYSLGVLLFELLTSRTPVGPDQTEGLGVSKLNRAVLDAEVVRPSVRLAGEEREVLGGIANGRSTDPSGLLHTVRGDLDWIVLKAMEKVRARRYQTVNSLAMDLKRYLQDQPVIARPPGRLYLMRKFVRRNSIAVGLSAVLVCALVVGLVLTTMLYHRSEVARDRELVLKNEATAARMQEQHLRVQADARANVARVAMLLDQGRIIEADVLRKEYPLSSIDPSLEAAAVFRSLGDWHAQAGRMDQALPCFRLLMQANRYDRPDSILQGEDLLSIGAALIEFSPEEYRVYRREVVDSYMPPEGRLQAEHLLKFCLLGPADEQLLNDLGPAVEVLGDPRMSGQASWDALAIGLYRLRRGEFDAAIDLGHVGLADGAAKLSCEAALHTVIAMAQRGKGNEGAAEEEIAIAAQAMRDADGRDFVDGQPLDPLWWDWSIVGSLLREAQGEVRKPGPL